MDTDDMPDRTLAQRVRIILKTEGWNQSQLAREVGAKSPGTVGNWLHRNEGMDPKFALQLQSKHRWNARWILEGKGPRKLKVRTPEEEEILQAVNDLPTEDLLALGRFVRRTT